MTEPEVRTLRSFCRICTAVCGILVHVADDEVIRMRGDQEHPLSHGYTCPKGRALPKVHHHPDRIEQPMMRVHGPVVVRGNRGAVTGTAKVDPAIRRGVVSMPHGHHDANVNLLSDKDVIDPVTGMVRYSAPRSAWNRQRLRRRAELGPRRGLALR
jgi:anaerobic selenocysteine-containing dehydrogenase